MRDCKHLSHFLNIQASYVKNKLILTQQQYALDILHRSRMHNCCPSSNNSTSKEVIMENENKKFPNPTFYRQLVGALQYITITKPNLSFSVNCLCQYMHNPLNLHFQQLKRVLRYLQATSSYGLLIQHADLTLTTYSDSD